MPRISKELLYLSAQGRRVKGAHPLVPLRVLEAILLVTFPCWDITLVCAQRERISRFQWTQQKIRFSMRVTESGLPSIVELGVMLKQGGRDIKAKDWKSYIGGYVLLLDYSDISLAKEAMANGTPWMLAKVCVNPLLCRHKMASCIWATSSTRLRLRTHTM